MSEIRPQLDLNVTVTNETGFTELWDPNDPDPTKRPMGMKFGTRRGEGYAGGSLDLFRKIDRDYDDLGLLNDVTFLSLYGEHAYEGRIAGLPRSLSESENVTVQLVGWMAHGRDRKFMDTFIDSDLDNWEMRPRYPRLASILVTANLFDAEIITTSESVIGAQLATQLVGPWNRTSISETWYDIGAGSRIGGIYVRSDWDGNSVNDADPNWSRNIYSSSGENGVFDGISGRLNGSGVIAAYYPFTAPTRYALLQATYAVAAGGNGQRYPYYWGYLTVYGDQGLPRVGAEPKGLLASDIMINIAQRFCPKLNTSGIQPSKLPIHQAAYRDPIDPYDAWLDLNKYELNELCVWENKTLCLYEADLTKADWYVELEEIDLDLQGDTTDNLLNGIVVTYVDVFTGTTIRLLPDAFPELQDRDPSNPANKFNIAIWTEIELTTPTTEEEALAAGRAALAEKQLLNSPGTIKLIGHIRDYTGQWQQGWKVHATETVSITNHPNPNPRFIVETDWDQDTLLLSMTVDNTSNRIEAVLDFIAQAVQAAKLG